MKKFLPILKNCPLFSDIDESEMSDLLNSIGAKKRSFEKGGLVSIAGSKASSFGIVLAGRVNVVQDSYWGGHSILAQISEGELFGEAFSCAQIESLPLSVVCALPCDILLIDYQKIISIGVSSLHLKLIKNMMRILARKNIILTQKMEHLSQRTTRQKLLSFLSMQAKQAGGREFEINFTQGELAEYLSVDRSAMCTELSKMQDEHLLLYKRSYFELL